MGCPSIMATALSPDLPLAEAEEQSSSWKSQPDEELPKWKQSARGSISTDSEASWAEVERILDSCNLSSDEEGEDGETSNTKRATYVQQQAAAFDYFQKINGVQQLGRYVPGSLENELSSSSDEQDLTFVSANERERLVERLQELAGDMFLVDDNLLEELIDLVPVGDREALRKTVSRPTYPIGESAHTDCEVCYERKDLKRRPCCRVAVCNFCLKTYIKTQVTQGIVKISCVMCTHCIPRDEIMDKLDKQMKEKFYRFLVDANKDPTCKTCPRCSHITKLEQVPSEKRKRMGFKVDCESCSLVWCFPCQAPWHEGISCNDYGKGDKMLKAWAREHHYGQVNAQKCPKCKAYIQRSSGCDHMTCSRCKTNFCYKCGERFRELRFIGDHYSKLSVFGCKYRFKPQHPTQRKLIRGAILGGKIMAAPLVGGLALGAGAVLLGVGVVILPFYGGYKLHTRIQRHKEQKRNLRYRQEWLKRLDEMRQKGENPISGPIYGDLFGEYSALDIHNPHRQSVDLNNHDVSMDSDTMSYLSHSDLEESIAVAQVQVDSYQLDRDLAEAQIDLGGIKLSVGAEDDPQDSKLNTSQYFDAADSLDDEKPQGISVKHVGDRATSSNESAIRSPLDADREQAEDNADECDAKLSNATEKAGCSNSVMDSNIMMKNKQESLPENPTAEPSKMKLKRSNFCYKRRSKSIDINPSEPKLEKYQEVECIGSVELKRKSFSQVYV